MTAQSSNNIFTPNQIQKALQEIQNFQTSIQETSSKLPILLEDFQKAYVTYHMNPANNEYERTFTNTNNQIQTLNSRLFSIQNTVQQNIKILDDNLMQLNDQIQKEKKENKYLTKKYNQINSKQEGSIERVEDFNEAYNREYWHNLYLFIGLLVSIYATIQMFRGKKDIITTNIS